MSNVQIPRSLVNQLLHHAQACPGAEVCGLISAIDGIPTRCYPVANAAPHPENRYRMDPKNQIEAMRHMREAGEELFAIYHSHPTAPAAPSNIDIDDANYPDCLYLIISLDTKGVLEMRGFHIQDKRVVERELELG